MTFGPEGNRTLKRIHLRFTHVYKSTFVLTQRIQVTVLSTTREYTHATVLSDYSTKIQELIMMIRNARLAIVFVFLNGIAKSKIYETAMLDDEKDNVYVYPRLDNA